VSEAKAPAAQPHFAVDKKGLQQILSRKDRSFVITELLQNAWDEDGTRVEVELRQDPDKVGLVTIVVEDDDPEGFTDITHAYTLFAESEKKSDASKRGRFNLGEKLVIAACETATISTTTGLIVFNDEGRFTYPPERTQGSRFEGQIKMDADEFGVVLRVVSSLIPPPDKLTIFNGEPLKVRTPVRTFETPVWTEFSGEDGSMRRTLRKTVVELYEPEAGEEAAIYEMGIPVVEADCRWHINVGQKVPLSIERDNVTPAWLRDIRRIVLNEAYDLLGAEDGDASWILDGMGDEEIKPEALKHTLDLRFGPAVAYDPSDVEANNLASAAGFSTITSRALPKEVWAQVKAAGVLPPAGQVTPSVKPYLPGQERSRVERPHDEWTAQMQNMAGFARSLAHDLLNVALDVAIVDDSDVMNFDVNYRPANTGVGLLEFNLRRLGHRWFEGDPVDHLDRLLYAFAHHYETDRLSSHFHEAVATLGRDTVQVALSDPGRWNEYRPTTY